MYVQDITSPGVNITAEIPKDEANNFKKMCSVFAVAESHGKFIDEYVSKLVASQADNIVNGCDTGSASTNVKSVQVAELKSISTANSINSDTSQSAVRTNIQEIVDGNTSVQSNPAKLEDVIRTDKATLAIATEMIHFVSRTKSRIHNESQIMNTLAGYLNGFDCKVQLVPFGSATYGFGGSSTNFNLLANTGEFVCIPKCLLSMYPNFPIITGGSEKSPLTLMSSFEKKFKNSSIHNDFEILEPLTGNRAQRRRLQLLHKKSRILCWLQFGFDGELAECSQIIRDFISHGPICK